MKELGAGSFYSPLGDLLSTHFEDNYRSLIVLGQYQSHLKTSNDVFEVTD